MTHAAHFSLSGFLLRNTLVACVCTGALLGLSMRASAGPVQKLDSELGPFSVEQVVKGLDHPWALAFLPHRQGMLVTERPGNLQVLTDEQDGALLKVGLE
ncbi:MAG: yliI [Pseudomonas sp.]|nr:yliI [Pseudomonas sp.]